MTTTSQKKILLNAFDMNSVGHINHGLWTVSYTHLTLPTKRIV